MVVGNDRLKFHPGRNEKISQNGFQFRLSTLEIIPTDEHLMFLGQFDQAGHESVLRTTVDVRTTFEDRRTGEDVRGTDLIFVRRDRAQNLLAALIQTWTD